MGTLRMLTSRLRAFLSARRRDAELDDEIQAHLRLLADDRVRGGMSREDAMLAARREFGGVEQMKETYRDQRGLPSIECFVRDLRLALRTLSRSPGFAAAVTVTLALGIGATVAMFTVFDQVVLRPLPYPNADRLVRVESPVPGIRAGAIWNLSTAEYFYFRDHVRAFERIGLYVSTSGTLAAVSDVPGSTAERVATGIVSSETLHLLGARAVVGRLFTPDDEHYDLRSQSPPVVVLSYDMWLRRFGGRPDMVGRTVLFEEHPYPIVGVLGPGVELPETAVSLTTKVGLWMPIGLDPTAPAVNVHTFRAIARLRPEATLAEAQRELNLLTPTLPELFPSAYSPAFMADTRFSAAVVPLRDDVLGTARRILWVLAGAIGLVFLIAISNIANLFVARAEARHRARSIRLALGATGWTLLRYTLAESLVLCLLATCMGVALASITLRVIAAWAITTVPRFTDVHLDLMSLVAASGAALVSAAGFAVLSGTRSPVYTHEELRQQLPTASRRHHRIRHLLVTAQVALALVLVAGAALMARSVQHVFQVRPGFDATGVLMFDVMLPRTRYTSEERVAAYHQALAVALKASPNIDIVSAATSTPLDGNDGCDAIFVEGQLFESGRNPCVDTTRVAPDYFEALRIQVRQHAPGWSTARDAAVVSESLARRLWPSGDPIGKGIRVNGDGPSYYRVLAVVANVHRDGFDKPPAETAYFPIVSREGAPLHGTPRGMRVVIRTRTVGAGAIMPDVRQTLARIDPNVPVANVETLADVVNASMARRSFTTMLLASAALLAMVLSTVGLYGVIAYGVATRQSEIGVRLALGARPAAICGMVIYETSQLVLTGLGVGLVAALASTRFLAGFLYGVSPNDPTTLISVATLLLSVGLTAGMIPAWRASRVDPIIALRCE
jgi:putative ABC transport system permease protein